MGYLKGLLFACLAIFGFMAFGADPALPPESVDQALGFLPAIIAAALAGKWLLVGAGVALVGTWALRVYVLPKLGLGSGVLPIVSAVLGILAGVGGAVYVGAPLDVAAQAVMAGPLASFLFEAIFKYFFSKPA